MRVPMHADCSPCMPVLVGRSQHRCRVPVPELVQWLVCRVRQFGVYMVAPQCPRLSRTDSLVGGAGVRVLVACGRNELGAPTLGADGAPRGGLAVFSSSNTLPRTLRSYSLQRACAVTAKAVGEPIAMAPIHTCPHVGFGYLPTPS